MRREKDGPATREAILDAALRTFTENTFAGSSMADVAQRAGVAVGSIYRHFPSKDSLGSSVYQLWKGRALSATVAAVDPAAPSRTAFGQIWRALTRFAAEHPDAFAFLEYQQHEAYLDETGQAAAHGLTTFARDFVVRGQQAGEIRPGPPDMLIALAYGALVGFTRQGDSGSPRSAADPALVAEAEEAVWAMLRADG
ncbi:TetR/AcrR family transcriptional regulator [Phytohabitans sp. LJ34]|uniref:TetR/AcrR family transcriptional regulator n=1 Tax=Phytohabitans sp. LJ34 TaxID=3452217 RepID=UPI003F8A241B